MATLLQLPALEPTTQSFVDALAVADGPPLYELSPAAARKFLANVQALPVEKLPASLEDTTFPVGPSGTVQGNARSTLPGNRGGRQRRCRFRRLRSLARGEIPRRDRASPRRDSICGGAWS